jgi:hypothetical protein
VDRRGFFKLFGLGIGGIALEQAIPFNRVWSFPTKIMLPVHPFDFRAELTRSLNRLGKVMPELIPELELCEGDIITMASVNRLNMPAVFRIGKLTHYEDRYTETSLELALALDDSKRQLVS